MKEVWKDVIGYEGIYEVSNTGKIKRLKNNTMRKTKKNNRGYVQISLSKNGEIKYFLLHRVVAQAFIENENNFPQVNHKDEDKENNHIDNLEWCTNLYNRRYGSGYQRSVMNHNYKEIAKLRCKPVKQFDKSGNLIRVFFGATEAEIQTGIKQSKIRASARKGCFADGYKWEYVNKFG